MKPPKPMGLHACRQILSACREDDHLVVLHWGDEKVVGSVGHVGDTYARIELAWKHRRYVDLLEVVSVVDLGPAPEDWPG